MAKIGLTSGFTLVPEGTHIFKIVDVVYKEDFGRLEVVMETEDGLKHTERYSLLKADGSVNTRAYNAFSFFAKTAMQDFGLREIDHTDLIGHYIECDVTHDVVENRNKPGETVTFARLGDKRQSDGWGGNGGKLDLKSLLG